MAVSLNMSYPEPKIYYRSLSPLLDRSVLAGGPDWNQIFGRSAPRELEIGFGNGEYLNRSSLAAPENDFIGLEIAWASVKRALRRLAEPPRTNVRLLCLPAKPALELLFPPESLDVIRVLFPVPWPRASHENKRLFSAAFLSLASGRLKKEGLFYLVTDDLNLAQWTQEQARSSDLSLVLAQKPAHLDTKYERKWQNSGQQVFYHLQGHPGSRRSAPPPGLLIMQPAFLSDFDPRTYSPRGQTGPVTVVFGDFLYDPLRREGLLLAKVAEDQFVQEFFIRLAPLPDGRYKLTPAVFGQALPTAGVQTALILAAAESGDRV
ncbi:MAG: hypothetical protein LBK52_00920 [Deltaproteobacteria bacterium]|nr:hypothetical protein [Deltaproteobacteria bacterium]